MECVLFQTHLLFMNIYGSLNIRRLSCTAVCHWLHDITLSSNDPPCKMTREGFPKAPLLIFIIMFLYADKFSLASVCLFLATTIYLTPELITSFQHQCLGQVCVLRSFDETCNISV